MAFELPPLPYPKNALEPHTSAQTLDFHHGKHHQAYVTNLNNLVKDTPMESQSLEEIIKATAKDASKTGIFNNAAQVWNHTFFWNCMKPNGGGTPSGERRARRSTAISAASPSSRTISRRPRVGQFGSGWAWLVADGGKLKITSTPNAGQPAGRGPDRAARPATCGSTPITSTSRTAGPDFVQAFLDHLVNWDFVAAEPGEGEVSRFVLRRPAHRHRPATRG